MAVYRRGVESAKTRRTGIQKMAPEGKYWSSGPGTSPFRVGTVQGFTQGLSDCAAAATGVGKGKHYTAQGRLAGDGHSAGSKALQDCSARSRAGKDKIGERDGRQKTPRKRWQIRFPKDFIEDPIINDTKYCRILQVYSWGKKKKSENKHYFTN